MLATACCDDFALLYTLIFRNVETGNCRCGMHISDYQCDMVVQDVKIRTERRLWDYRNG